MAGAPSPRSSTGHLVWSSSYCTPNRNSMSFLNSAPKFLWDRDKPGNLTPNDAYNFAILPSVPPPALKWASHPSFLEWSCYALLASWQPRPLGRRSLSPISNTAQHHILRSASPRSSSGRLASPLPVAFNQISNKITYDTCAPLGLEHAYTKLSDDALARLGGVLRILLERRPITAFEGGYFRAGTGESLMSRGCMRLRRD